jgi:hypothetical protein
MLSLAIKHISGPTKVTLLRRRFLRRSTRDLTVAYTDDVVDATIEIATSNEYEQKYATPELGSYSTGFLHTVKTWSPVTGAMSTSQLDKPCV